MRERCEAPSIGNSFSLLTPTDRVRQTEGIGAASSKDLEFSVRKDEIDTVRANERVFPDLFSRTPASYTPWYSYHTVGGRGPHMLPSKTQWRF